MDIYSILSSKPHNPHYLNRYIKFIQYCQIKNFDMKGYTEKHHICPKAQDMFPEYKNFKKYPWNKIILTARQHYLAHFMLWKCYENYSSTQAFYWMQSNFKYSKMNNRLYERLSIQFAKNISKIQKNKVSVFEGDKIIRITSEEYKNGNYKHANKNKVVVKMDDGSLTTVSSEEYKNGNYKHNASECVSVKDINGNTFQTSIYDPKYISGELVGCTKGYFVAYDENGNKIMTNNRHLKSIHKNLIPVILEDGSIKKLSKSDPDVISGKYKFQFTDTVTVRDKNGNYFRVEKTDPRYLSGELVGSQRGKITITDGVRNKRIFPNDIIPIGWERGMTVKK